MQPHIDGNKNVKSQYVFERSSDSAHASNFLIHFLLTLHNVDLKLLNFGFWEEVSEQQQIFLPFICLQMWSLIPVIIKENLPTPDKLKGLE